MMAGDKRRTHNKSRLGCKNCKGRKIKCDEQKPACANCLKRNDKCDFLGSESPRFAISPGGLNMTDLELLHNYTTTTHVTLSADPAIRDFYRVSVVQVGFTCDYIMRALLAVSSLHLAHFRPHMREHYQSVAIVHYQAASRIAMPLIPEVSNDTAQPLFLFSVLTTYYTLGWPRDPDDVLLLGDSGFPDWLFVLRGIRGILHVAGVPRQGPLSPLFTHAQSRFELRDAADSESPATTPLQELREAISQRALPDEQTGTYIAAVDELAKSFRHAQQSTSYDIIDAFVWLFIVAEELLPLLRVPTQEAVAIVAFFCALLRRLEDRWWLKGWPVSLVARAWGLLDEEWRLWVRWPVEEVGWVPPSAVV